METVLNEWSEKLLELFKDIPQDPRQFISCKAPTGDDMIEMTSGGIYNGQPKELSSKSALEAFDSFVGVIKPMIQVGERNKLYWRLRPRMIFFPSDGGFYLVYSRFAVSDKPEIMEVPVGDQFE